MISMGKCSASARAIAVLPAAVGPSSANTRARAVGGTLDGGRESTEGAGMAVMLAEVLSVPGAYANPKPVCGLPA